MDILVLGNGFDLAHGLKTSYKDFLEYLNQEINDENGNKEIKDLCKENTWFKYFIDKYDSLGNKWIDFESEMFRVIESLDALFVKLKDKKYLTMNSHISYILKIGISENMKQNIINLTDELENNELLFSASQFLDKYFSKKIEKLIIENKEVPDFYGDKVDDITKKLEVDLNNLILCLEIYLNQITKNDINKLDFFQKNKFNRVISFNYTDTYRNIYNQNEECKYLYIHGSIRNDNNKRKNNMVLGIAEYLSDDLKDEQLNFVTFKKYFQRILKNTDSLYKELLKSIKKNNNCTFDNKEKSKIYIYGHSLDVMDKDILYDILSVQCDIVIFFYDDKDYYSKIANIVKIIGQDAFKERFHSKKNRIIFRHCDTV